MANLNDWITGEGLRPYLHGIPFLGFEDGRVQLYRLDPAAMQYPLDAWKQARMPAGGRLEFHSSALEIRIRLRYTELLAAPQISLWNGQERVGLFTPPAGQQDCEAVFTLPAGGGTFTCYLPYISVVEIDGIGPAQALKPVPPHGPRWLAYGDSITHGWSASDPALAYPAIIARRFGLEHANLGLAGAARGEFAVANTIAAMPADVISLAFGTNTMKHNWYDKTIWRESVRTFIELLRVEHPTTPIVLITPISRSSTLPNDGWESGRFEKTPTKRGMLQDDIRRGQEDVVAAMQRAGDKNIHLLSGLAVIAHNEDRLLADGIHPNDQGMHRMADVIGQSIASVLKLKTA